MQQSRFNKPMRRIRIAIPDPEFYCAGEETAPETSSHEISDTGVDIAGATSAGDARVTEVAEDARGKASENSAKEI